MSFGESNVRAVHTAVMQVVQLNTNDITPS